jgi:uncharacterized BrkB/YihY/UPF0761 family membrane protein
VDILDDIRWRARQMLHQFGSRNCLTRAGALTYTTLFAVVPFMTVTYTVLSLRPEFADVASACARSSSSTSCRNRVPR